MHTLIFLQKVVICLTKTPRLQKRSSQSEAAVIWLYTQLKALLSAKAKNLLDIDRVQW